ncbi:radical SAM/SPASM domain-containing protein [Bacteroidota bacterium]
MQQTLSASYYIRRFLRRQFVRKKFSVRAFVILLLLARTILKGDRLRKKNEKRFQTSIPPICILSVTSTCNLSCKGCYAINHSSADVLNDSDIEKIIREATGLGIYLFIISGGEPLMHENLLQILSRYPKAIFLIFTNGLLINSKHINSFKRNRHIFPVVSFEGNKNFNDFRRGKGSGSAIENSLKVLSENNLIYGFSSMAIPGNVDYIISKSYFDKMESYGTTFGFIIDYIPSGNNVNHALVLSDDELARKKEELLKRRRDSNNFVFNLPIDESLFGHCGAAGKLLIHINAAGQVSPCTFNTVSKDNIKNSTLIDILKSGFFKEFRIQMDRNGKINGRCSMHEKKEELCSI